MRELSLNYAPYNVAIEINICQLSLNHVPYNGAKDKSMPELSLNYAFILSDKISMHICLTTISL